MAYILGVDPGFASVGMVGLEFKSSIRDSRITFMSLIRTEKESKKMKIRLGDDNQRRHGIIHQNYKMAIERRPDVVAVEAVSHVRNASTMCQIGGAWYGLYYMLLDRGIYTATYMPSELKKIATGKKSAGKDDMVAAVESRWPGQIDWSMWPASKHQHVADAAVAAWAAAIDVNLPWSMMIGGNDD